MFSATDSLGVFAHRPYWITSTTRVFQRCFIWFRRCFFAGMMYMAAQVKISAADFSCCFWQAAVFTYLQYKNCLLLTCFFFNIRQLIFVLLARVTTSKTKIVSLLWYYFWDLINFPSLRSLKTNLNRLTTRRSPSLIPGRRETNYFCMSYSCSKSGIFSLKFKFWGSFSDSQMLSPAIKRAFRVVRSAWKSANIYYSMRFVCLCEEIV